MPGKQARVITHVQEKTILGYLTTTRNPERDKVMFLLSCKAGLRAKEIAALTWSMVTDAHGDITDTLTLPDQASKGKSGRALAMHPDLQAALTHLQQIREDQAIPERAVIYSERSPSLSAQTVRLWFHQLFKTLEMEGCSSHSGRRTFITRVARNISRAGGSVRDVQGLAGHKNVRDTMRYIDVDTDAQRKVVAMI